MSFKGSIVRPPNGELERDGRRGTVSPHSTLPLDALRFTHHASRITFLLISLLLASCASQDKKKKADYSSLPMEQRIIRQMKDPYAVKSPFQKQVYNASRSVKTSKYRATEYHANKTFFSGKDKFKTGEFAQAGKASHAGAKTFSGADDKSHLGTETFKTNEDRLGGKVSSASDKTSPLSNEVYTARTNAMTRKDASIVKKPLIEDQPTSYSEQDVKKLLNKN